jgi:hypothetical protein
MAQNFQPGSWIEITAVLEAIEEEEEEEQIHGFC